MKGILLSTTDMQKPYSVKVMNTLLVWSTVEQKFLLTNLTINLHSTYQYVPPRVKKEVARPIFLFILFCFMFIDFVKGKF